MARVLIFSDTHCPFMHPGFIDAVKHVEEQWNIDTYVFGGDAVDNYATSRYTKDPDGFFSAHTEGVEAEAQVAQLHKAFPNAYACVGNHDERPWRLASGTGIPSRCMRTLEEVLPTPTWSWSVEHEIDGVVYVHGTGRSGDLAAINEAVSGGKSVVMGHQHSRPAVQWRHTRAGKVFGMIVGWGGDLDAYAFAYGKNAKLKAVHAVGVVIDGEFAVLEPLELQ